MTRKKEVVLYFGSFNPIHRGHVALAEWVVEHVACDEVTLIVSPQNPLKADSELAPELARFEMAELACAASRYPERIKPSAIEFLLDKPSYTIHTLRHLQENYGDRMHFQILMGADLVPQLDRWKDYRELVDNYPLLVYPRQGYDLKALEDLILYIRKKYGVEVYLEPGEAIALNAGSLITTVLDVVQASDMPVLILDASAACHMPDVLEMPYRPPLFGAGEAGEKPCTCRLAARTCLAGDVIGEYSFDKQPQVGDRLVFGDMAI